MAGATLDAAPKEQLIAFAPVKARFVKLVVRSTQGNGPAEIGEVQIYETAHEASIVDDVPRDLVLPSLGGSLVQFTSQLREGVAAELIDGQVNNSAGCGDVCMRRREHLGQPGSLSARRGSRSVQVPPISACTHTWSARSARARSRLSESASVDSPSAWVTTL